MAKCKHMIRNLIKPHFRPSVCERPMFRLRFLSPQQEQQQTTIGATWTCMTGLDANGEPFDEKTITESQNLFAAAVTECYRRSGCTIISMELIKHQTIDLDDLIK